MKENLRVKHYADGTALSLGNDTSSMYAYYYYANGDANNTSVYGLQYNWKAAMGNLQAALQIPPEYRVSALRGGIFRVTRSGMC